MFVGIDGCKMSKSYGNIIVFFEDLESVRKKVMNMVIDFVRICKNDSGYFEVCIVFVYY